MKNPDRLPLLFSVKLAACLGGGVVFRRAIALEVPCPANHYNIMSFMLYRRRGQGIRKKDVGYAPRNGLHDVTTPNASQPFDPIGMDGVKASACKSS